MWTCCFDLETVPCLETLGRLHGLNGCDDAKAEELLGGKFAKAPVHRIACIGALLAERVEDRWEVRSLGAPHIGDRSEAELITGFVNRIGELRPTLVGFNSHAFDLNVLRYRAMIHEIAAPGLSARGYFKRYDDSAVDLMEVLSGYDSRSRMKLDELARAMAFPGKPEGVDGSRVWDMFKEGRIAEVAHYCEADIVATYRLWLRYELFRGTLTKAGFDASEAHLTSYIKARLQERPHLAFLVAVDRQPAEPVDTADDIATC